MVKLNVIEKSKQPSEWQSNLIIIEIPDKMLRLYLDPKKINKYIEPDMCLIPILDGMRLILSNRNSLLELKKDFYHCELGSESVMLCTFSSSGAARGWAENTENPLPPPPRNY